MDSEARQGFVGVPLVLPGRGRVAVDLQGQSMLAGQPEDPGAGHLFVAPGDMESFGRNLVGSIKTSVSPQSGGHDSRRARTGLRPFRVSSRLGQATDLPVTQAVVDKDEKFAGGRHPADVRAPAFAHAVVVAPDRGVAALAGHGLDCGPAHQARTLFGDMASADLGVGLVVGRGEPGPAAQVPGALEPRMSPISATKTEANTGPTPGMAWTAW